MSLVPSLLQAIVGLDGEACVIHVGEKPYVVAPTGQVDLATRGLTFEAVNGILEQLLPIETQNALDEFGAIQYELPPRPDLPNEHFTVVVARGGDDVWVEIRRRRTPDVDAVPPEAFLTPSALPAHDPESMRRDHEALSMPNSADLWPGRGADESRGRRQRSVRRALRRTRLRLGEQRAVALQGSEHRIEVLDRVVTVRRDAEAAVTLRGDDPVAVERGDECARVL